MLAWDRRTGRPLTPAHRLAGPAVGRASAQRARRRRPSRLAALTGLPLDPYFAAPKMAWLRENLTADGVVTTTDTWLVHRLGAARSSPTRRPRPGRCCSTSTRRTGRRRRAARSASTRRRCPRSSTAPAVVGETTAFGPPLPVTGLAVDQQAALLAERCFAAGRGQVHLRHRRVPARHHRAGPVQLDGAACPPRSPGGSAGRPTYCLDGQVYTAGAAVRWLADLGLLAGAADLDAVGGSVPRHRRRDVRARAGRARRAVLARRTRAARSSGSAWAPPGRTWSGALVEGIAAQVGAAGRRGRRRPRRPARPRCGSTAGSPGPRLLHAGAGRPAAGCRSRCTPSPDATALGVAALARLGDRRDAATPAEAVGPADGGRSIEPRDRRRPRPPSGWRRSAVRAAGASGERRRVTGRGDRGAAPTSPSSGPAWSAPRSPASCRRYRLARACCVDAANDVGTGTTQGEHGDPAHRVRRRRPARLEAGCCAAGYELLARLRAPRPASRSSAPARCSWPGPTSSARRCPAIADKAAPNGYTDDPRRIGGRRALPARAAPRARRAGRAGGPGREHHLPVDDAAGLRHRGACRRGASCGSAPGSTGVERGRGRRASRCATTGGDRCAPRWLVNAAGLHGDARRRACSAHDGFTVTPAPRRADRVRQARPAAAALDPAAGARRRRRKGVLVAPTVYGNVLLGPTARGHRRPRRHRDHRGRAGLAAATPGRRIVPGAARRGGHRHLRRAAGRHRAPGLPDPGATPAGATPASAGIRSTGLSASLGIAEYVAGLLGGRRAAARGRARASRTRRSCRYIGEAGTRPVPGRRRGSPPTPTTAGSSATASGSPGARSGTRWPAPLPPADLDGLRRRTRALNGRCQGFYCAATVARLMAAGLATAGPPRTSGRERTGQRRVRERRRARSSGPARRGWPQRSSCAGSARAGSWSLDREDEAGGIPRHSAHTGFGLRDLHRVLTGPGYAPPLRGRGGGAPGRTSGRAPR